MQVPQEVSLVVAERLPERFASSPIRSITKVNAVSKSALGCFIKFRKPGYLYFFATNSLAWLNSGRVELPPSQFLIRSA